MSSTKDGPGMTNGVKTQNDGPTLLKIMEFLYRDFYAIIGNGNELRPEPSMDVKESSIPSDSSLGDALMDDTDMQIQWSGSYSWQRE